MSTTETFSSRALRYMTKALQVAALLASLGILFSGPFAPEINVTPEGVRYDFTKH